MPAWYSVANADLVHALAQQEVQKGLANETLFVSNDSDKKLFLTRRLGRRRPIC